MVSTSAPSQLGAVARTLLTLLGELAGRPAAWLTTFVDDADEVWVTDPLLDDDDGATSTLAW